MATKTRIADRKTEERDPGPTIPTPIFFFRFIHFPDALIGLSKLTSHPASDYVDFHRKSTVVECTENSLRAPILILYSWATADARSADRPWACAL